MKPLLVSSGEPAGIGPDLCLSLAGAKEPLVILGDKAVLAARAAMLQLPIRFNDYCVDEPVVSAPNVLTVLSRSCAAAVQPGLLNPSNAAYVIDLLEFAAEECAVGRFSAIVTAPVHKGIINQAGIAFTGHTEFFAEYFNVPQVVMMLACPMMRVALVTTHLPLRHVADAITIPLLTHVIEIIAHALQNDFGLDKPRIHVAGLNPHAGEGGYLGTEEQDIIIPALSALATAGLNVQGPYPADTLFTPEQLKTMDVGVAMYHDQGLPVIKHADFEHAVNVTLGLPIIRTSVDHGTALTLAGRGLAHTGSMRAAVEMAALMVERRGEHV